MLESCAFGKGELHERVVVTGAALATLAHPGSDLNFVSLWLTFVHPAAGEVEAFGDAVGHRQESGERLEVEVFAEVGEVLSDSEHPRWL